QALARRRSGQGRRLGERAARLGAHRGRRRFHARPGARRDRRVPVAARALERHARAFLTGRAIMSDEIEIVDYDPRWPARFALESARIRSVLAEPSLEIEHHGSTAVPGLAAKPVIDMLVATDSMARATRYAMVLVEYGYQEVDPRYRELWPERIV